MDVIYLTGLPRSGTSWAARALAAAIGAYLVDEPFNGEFYPERARFEMAYVRADSAESPLHALLRRDLRHWRHPRRTLRIWLRRRVLIKDVHTALALPHISRHITPRAVILVRHPCAVADSWQRLNFPAGARLDTLLQQESLMADHLHPFAAHLRAVADPYAQVGALWGAVLYTLQRLSVDQPGWHWVTHESLCVEPAAAFAALAQRLGYAMRPEGVAFIRRHDRPPGTDEGPFAVARVSAEEPDKWRTRLTAGQIGAVLDGEAPFGMLDRYY